ncbi:MAG: N-acetylmuramoyl-L-alanine amidase [Prolixibacteraceae bacterium]|jgi:N-acetylmuramoyl-L-alanine amidase|nr:N-acetylmuramoyl-L-alanine amidase [Prolixibacteraceae bacterium]
MYIYKHNLVGSSVEYIWSKKNKKPIEELDNIVIHYTAGANAVSSAKYLAADNTPVSAHLVIARDGSIFQIVDFNTQAWHAGKSKYRKTEGLNAFSIGIELENYGLLKEKDDKYYTWFGKRVPEKQVVELINIQTGFPAFWQTYTYLQLKTLREVCQKLLSCYPIRRIVGHSEISLTGKIDPGPAFPLNDFSELIYR